MSKQEAASEACLAVDDALEGDFELAGSTPFLDEDGQDVAEAAPEVEGSESEDPDAEDPGTDDPETNDAAPSAQSASPAPPVAAGSSALAATPAAQSDVTAWTRLGGQTALDTAAKISQAGWKSAAAVVIASIDSYTDALCASALAGSLNAPVLLTESGKLSAQTRAEIVRLKASVAYIVGGTRAIAAAVEGQIKKAGCKRTVRVAGKTAQDTAIAVANRIATDGTSPRAATAIVVTDASFQDAMSIAPYAYFATAPIYLSSNKGAELDAKTASALSKGGFERAIVVGGKKAVLGAVVNQIKNAGIAKVVRLAGATAEDTSTAVANWSLAQGMSADHVGAASSAGFSDAMAGAAFCGLNASPILLMRPGFLNPIYDFVDPQRAGIVRGYIFGGRKAVSEGERLLLANRRVRVLPNGVHTLESSVAVNKMVDLKNAAVANKGNVHLFGANDNTTQRWFLSFGQDGFYTIYSVTSGKVLEAAGGGYKPNTNVWQYASNGTASQRWAILRNADGTYILLNKKSALAVAVQGGKTANGTNILLRDAAPSAKAQKFTPKATTVLSNGTYIFYTKLAQTVRSVDVGGASVDAGKQLQIFTQDGSPAQRFVLKNLGGDVCTIQAVVSGKYLAEASGKVVQQQGQASVPDAQKWKVEFKGGGIVLTNVASGKAITVSGNKNANNAKLTGAAYSGKAGQKFRPAKQSLLIAPGLYTFDLHANVSRRLSVKNGSWNNAANALLQGANSSNAQKFAVISDGGGYYHIIMALSGNALEANGSNARMAKTGYSTAAKYLWKAELTDNGLTFTNKATGTKLMAAGGKTASGTNVACGKANGARSQGWRLVKTKVNLSDATSLKNLIRQASTAGKPKLDAKGRKYSVSNAAYKQLMDALALAYNRGKYVDFFLADPNTGITYTLNADRRTYGASTIKAAYVTYIFQELIEKGKVSYGSVENLMWHTIVWSNNSTYAQLRNRFGSTGFKKWLDGQGVGWIGNQMYTVTTPRALELMWSKIYLYEESGGKYVGKWRTMFSRSDHSAIREQLSGANTVYSKPGWMFGGSYGTILDDGAIVKGKDGRTYILAMLSNLQPDGQRWIARRVAAALDRIHNEMPKS